jgi:AraC family ethanolamine operon transcriptional activator
MGLEEVQHDDSAGPAVPRRLQRQLSGFEAFGAAFPLWRGHFTQMSPGAFDGSLTVVAGARLRAFDAASNQALRLEADPDGQTATFIPITARNEGGLWQGRQLDRGALLSRGVDVAYGARTPRDARVTALIVDVATLTQALDAFSGGSARVDCAAWRAPTPEPAALARFEAALAALLAPPRANADPFARDAEAACLRSLADALLSTDGDVPSPTLRERTRLVAAATDYMRDRIAAPLTAMEICEAFGVSDRLLRLAFHETHGMGPLAYFRILRLHAARDALRAARGRDVTVGGLLAACGVTRPAAFAGTYRLHFGELPSETLGVRDWTRIAAHPTDDA